MKRLVGLMAAIALAVMTLLGFGHSASLSNLLTTVEASEATMSDSKDLFAASPKLTQMSSGWKYCLGGDQYGRCFWDASEAMTYWLSEYVNKKAEKVRQRLTIDRYQIEQTSILPIYTGVDKARGMYLKHVDAWIDYLEEFSSCMDYAKCVSNVKVNNISPTFLIAKEEFLKASWMTDLPNVEKRILEIFES